MVKYVVALTCFCLFFLVPMKDMKNDIKFLEEDKFILELEMCEKDKVIDSLNNVIFKLNKTIIIQTKKPIVKKWVTPEVTETVKVTEPDVIEIIKDTLK
jgi:hypothetical protein